MAAASVDTPVQDESKFYFCHSCSREMRPILPVGYFIVFILLLLYLSSSISLFFMFFMLSQAYQADEY